MAYMDSDDDSKTINFSEETASHTVVTKLRECM